MMETTSDKLTTYKVRKSGNSDVTTIPVEVKKALNIHTGDSVSFIITDKGTVELIKQDPQPDISTLIQESMNQYNELLEKLVEL